MEKLHTQRVQQFRLAKKRKQTLRLPINSRFLCVKYIDGKIIIFALILDCVHEKDYDFEIYNTNKDFEPSHIEKTYIGTVLAEKQKAFHIFKT